MVELFKHEILGMYCGERDVWNDIRINLSLNNAVAMWSVWKIMLSHHHITFFLGTINIFSIVLVA